MVGPFEPTKVKDSGCIANENVVNSPYADARVKKLLEKHNHWVSTPPPFSLSWEISSSGRSLFKYLCIVYVPYSGLTVNTLCGMTVKVYGGL